MGLIYTKDTKKYGRGVYSKSDIRAGQVIEISPVILFLKEESEYIKDTIISSYWFNWQANNFDSALALGYGSLFNHSYTPNAAFYNNYDSLEIIFYALSNIKANEEIVINYNGNSTDKSFLWFDVIN
ncbi:SET domain-containing protein [Priestia megaterium]|uniref:SET domain-containing protein n=1 Tax=Priestia megaterium TaxID=1404 RepID=UPI00317CB316